MRKTAAGAGKARREAELSRRRQRQAREQVIGPLQRFDDENHFAELIRQSLTEGRGRG